MSAGLLVSAEAIFFSRPIYSSMVCRSTSPSWRGVLVGVSGVPVWILGVSGVSGGCWTRPEPLAGCRLGYSGSSCGPRSQEPSTCWGWVSTGGWADPAQILLMHSRWYWSPTRQAATRHGPRSDTPLGKEPRTKVINWLSCKQRREDSDIDNLNCATCLSSNFRYNTCHAH